MQGEHWMKIAKSRHKWYFADSIGRSNSFKQQYKRMPLRFLYEICSFDLFFFRQKRIAGVHVVYLLPIKYNDM